MSATVSQAFDYLDKGCFAGTSGEQGCSNAPTWELVIDGQPTAEAVHQALTWLCTVYPICNAIVRPLDGPSDVAADWEWTWQTGQNVARLLDFKDLRDAPAADLLALRDAVHDRFLDLLTTPPLHVTLAWVAEGRSHLFFLQHHGIADGRAFVELLTDFAKFLDHAVQGTVPDPTALTRAPRLPELEAFGLTIWQRRWLAIGGFFEYLRGLGVSLRRPVSNLRQNASVDYTGSNCTIYVPVAATLVERCKAAAKAKGANFNALLMAAHFIANKRWNEEVGIAVRHLNMTVVAENRPRGGSFRSFANHLCWLIPQVDVVLAPTLLQVMPMAQRELKAQMARRAHIKRYFLERLIVLRMQLGSLRRMIYGGKHTIVNLNFSNLLALPIGRLEGEGWRVRDVLVTTPTMPRTGVVLTATSYDGAVTLNFNYKASICKQAEVERLSAIFMEEIAQFAESA